MSQAAEYLEPLLPHMSLDNGMPYLEREKAYKDAYHPFSNAMDAIPSHFDYHAFSERYYVDLPSDLLSKLSDMCSKRSNN